MLIPPNLPSKPHEEEIGGLSSLLLQGFASETSSLTTVGKIAGIKPAGWNEELLRLELVDLQEMAFDLSLLGFNDAEQAMLLAERTEGLVDPDEVPPVPIEPVSRPGDLCCSAPKATGCLAVIVQSRPTSSACSALSSRI
jgi:hypothetical protein